ncbi:MAG: hypothetical protein E7344_01775 [Clostridiales bacterium]|nr:hypothetical protein [Clostridiales bacterium]
MDFYNKLPRNKKEFVLFMLVISVISVNIIAPLITCFEVGFSFATWANVLKILPIMWPTVIVIVLATYIPAEWLTHKVVSHGDSFKTVVTINILCTVFLMSIILTVVGTWVGTQSISIDPIVTFFHKWQRNFAISFGVEALIAQPIARFVMSALHKHLDAQNAPVYKENLAE